MLQEPHAGSLRGCPGLRLCVCAGIEDLREKREQILKQIQDEENEKAKIQTELAALTQRLARVNGLCVHC